MGIFDSILGQVSQHADVGNMAAKLGIPAEVAEKAIAALGQALGLLGQAHVFDLQAVMLLLQLRH